MLTLRRIRMAVVLVVFAIVATACSSGDDPTASPNYVSFPDTQEAAADDGLTVASSAAEQAAEVQAVTADYDYVESLVQNFLDTRSAVLVKGADLSELERIAGDAAIQAVVAERDVNNDKIEQEYLSAVDQLNTWPNITTIERAGDAFVVRDCTERQEVNAAGHYNSWFVDRTYTLKAKDGADIADTNVELFIDDFTTLHNGYLEIDERLGCVPQSFAERAEATAAGALQELVSAARNPAEAEELSLRFSDEIRAELTAAIASQAADELALVNTEEAVFTAIGIDTHVSLLDFSESNSIVVVESCRSFPEGLIVVDGAGIEVQLESAGTEAVQWVHVRIPTLYGSAAPVHVVMIEDRPDLTCGDQS